MKPIKYVTSVLLFFLVALSNYVSAQVDNPYNLVTDGNLESTWPEIESYWSSGEAGSFIGVDDIEIKYRIFRHPEEIGAIVISSGRTETYIKYKEMVYNLSRLGYTIYIHDHRGQGFSGRMTEDTQQGHVQNFDDYVTDLKTFYDKKVKPNEHKNLFLLAHSMGGAIATLYIETYQNDFAAAALSSPMHQPDTGTFGGVVCKGAGITTFFRGIGMSWFGMEPRYAVGQGSYKRKTFAANDPDIMTHSKQRFEAIQDLYDKNGEVKIGGITSHWLANACDASETLLENAKSVKIPVLVLQAEEDIAVTATGQNTFCKNLASSGERECEGGKPYVIQGGYHELFIESDEYRIPAITKILRFFEKQSSLKNAKEQTSTKL